jgi:hypothetical protein
MALACLSAGGATASTTATRGAALSARQAKELRALIRAHSGGYRHGGYLIPPRAHGSIVNGAAAEQGAWDFMAFIAHLDAAQDVDVWCSGTLIAPNLVLTAGHCATDGETGQPLDPSGYRIVTGAVDKNDMINGQTSKVRQVVVQPAFDPKVYAGDAALLVLATPSTAQPVRIARNDESVPYTPGRDALIAGWGLPSQDGDASEVLQVAPTNVRGPDYCEQFWDEFQSAWDTCAAQWPELSTATCQGDSGGPLLTRDVNGDWVEIGVTSVGPVDCNTNSADYFTRTDVISSWAAEFAVAIGSTSGSTTTTSSSSSTSTTATTSSSITSTTSSTTTTTSTTTTKSPVPKPPVGIPLPVPTLTMANARSYAARMVRTRTHRRPRLGLSCRRLNQWSVHCAIRWKSSGSSYAVSGRFYHYLQGSRAYWWYDFTGTRRWKTCRVRHRRRSCTAYVQRFRWR